jgi:predicted transcriptional regulator
MKKPISVGIPENLAVSLDELAKKTGRKKNLIIAASLNNFLKANEDEQERTIRKYLEVERTLGENT